MRISRKELEHGSGLSRGATVANHALKSTYIDLVQSTGSLSAPQPVSLQRAAVEKAHPDVPICTVSVSECYGPDRVIGAA